MIIVIGDNAIDETVVVQTRRLCPEAPVPVVVPLYTVHRSGMAGNVYDNLRSMSNRPAKDFLFFTSPTANKKLRYVDEATGYIMLRVDSDIRDASRERFDISRTNLISLINRKQVETIVISDYGKGFLDESAISQILSQAEARGIPVFLDTKFILGDWSSKVFCAKINAKEYEQNCKHVVSPETKCKNLVVTCAEKGARLYESNGTMGSDIPTSKVNVADVCGAGDVMLAALALSYPKYPLYTAVSMALRVASFSVTQRGTYTVTRDDIKSLGVDL